jgi:hypothetical protein
MGGTPGMTAQQVATAPVINPTPSIPTSPTTGFTRAGEGFTNMFDTGQVGTDARSAFMKATPTGSLTAAGTTVASALTPEPEPLKASVSNIRPYSLDISNPSGTPQYTPQDTREREQVRYTYTPQPIYQAAQGGLAALNGQTYDDEYGRDEYEEGGSVKKRKSRSLKGDPYYKFAQDRRDSSMEASIAQNFAKGGLGADEQKLFGKNNWYDWSIENWGTKWEISSDGDTAELENGMLTMMFRSAWSPPVQAISKIKLPFELYFWESGAGYMGQLIKDSKSSPAVENSMGINIPEEKTKTEDDVYAFLKEQCENNNINPDIIDYMGMVCSYTEYK